MAAYLGLIKEKKKPTPSATKPGEQPKPKPPGGDFNELEKLFGPGGMLLN